MSRLTLLLAAALLALVAGAFRSAVADADTTPTGVQWLTQAVRDEGSAVARRVTLPDEWVHDHAHPDAGGAVHRYMLQFDAPPRAASGTPDANGRDTTTTLHALAIDRGCSALRVWLNGELVHDGGRFREPVTRHCHLPHLVPVPGALLKPGVNRLELDVVGYPAAQVVSPQHVGGLSPIAFGPWPKLAARHAERVAIAGDLPRMLGGALLLMGGFLVVLGSFHRRDQSHLGYLGVLMIAWSVLLARLWSTDLPWPNPVTEGLLVVLMAVIAWASIQFLLRFDRRRARLADVVLPLQAVGVALSMALAGPPFVRAVSWFWYVVFALEVGVVALRHLRGTSVARPDDDRRVTVTLALVVAASFVARVLAITLRWPPLVAQLAELVAPLAFVVAGLRLVQSYGRAFRSAEASRDELEQRVREARADIERTYEQIAQLRAEQMTDRERKRIAGDLHDDLGAKLLTIVHTSDSDRISTLAREALEEMRLSVRGLTGRPVRLADAFGDWRAELMARLGPAGIHGEWHAPPEEDVPHTLSSRTYVQTTRILREAVSNMIKHSGASQCIVQCALEGGNLQLVVQDNGRGIRLDGDEPRVDSGHGMASMKGRAKQLAGQCLVESSPGYGTVIRLTLPLDAQATTA